MPRWQQRRVAAGAGALFCAVLLYLAEIEGLQRLLAVLNPVPNLLAGAFLMALAALLRPWSLLMRFLQPLAPRFAAMGLLWPHPLVLLQRDALVQALGWTTATCLAAGLTNWLLPGLRLRLIGTTLEGLALALSLAAALLVLLPLGLWWQGLPRRWARARLAGHRDGAATSDALALAANLMLLLAGLLLLFTVVDDWALQPADSLPRLLPALLVCWALHAGLRQWLAGAPPEHAALWLAVLPPEPAANAAADASANSTTAAPPETQTLLALAHQLAGHWHLGPVTVLLPDVLPASGEHLHAARMAGRAGALFPTLPVQLADWQRTLPPAARWAALPLRELHLPRRWMADAAASLLQPTDRLLVLADPQAELAAWQPLLQGRAGRVLRLGAPGADNAGPAVGAGERSTARLKAAALALLRPLRPQPETAAEALGASADSAASITALAGAVSSAGPVQSAAGSTTTSAGPGLPKLPSLARLGLFAALSALLLLAGFLTLRLQLNDQSDGVASGYAALRLQTTALATATGAATGAPAPSSLRTLLAPDVTAGLMSVSDEPGRSVITLRSDGLFEPGSASVQPSSQTVLSRVAAALGRSGPPVLVLAHTDNQPIRSARFPSNFHLSSERANSVLALLADGVDRGRLRAEGRADTEPVVPNSTPAGRATNRRIEIVLQQPAGVAAQAAPLANEPAPAAGAANNVSPAATPPQRPAAPAGKTSARAK